MRTNSARLIPECYSALQTMMRTMPGLFCAAVNERKLCRLVKGCAHCFRNFFVIEAASDNVVLKEYMPEIPVGIITVPDMSFLTMFNLSQYLPAEKPLAEYELEDVKGVPGMVSMILKGFGAKGRSPEDTLLEAVHAVAAATPSGTTYSELKEMLQQEADIASFVESLDFPLEYVVCHYNSLSEDLLEAMHKQGKGVMAWTPDEDKDLAKVLTFSPDGIITNRPDAALAISGE